jgi:hypothetical protein
MALLLLRLPLLLPDGRALVSAPIHGRAGYRPCQPGERLRRAGGGGLERGPLVVEKRLQRFPEVLHQMEPIHHVDGGGRTAPDAVRVQGTPVPADERHGGMLGQPGGHAVR